MSKSKLPFATSAEAALDHWTTHGLPVFGVPTVGTPDDAIETIRRLQEKTGGFGTFMFLATNCASWEATKRSYALFAEHVIPAVRDMNVGRVDSIDYVGDNAGTFFGAMQDAVREAIAKYKPQ
jgi:limonene 1,2-monooxygenase